MADVLSGTLALVTGGAGFIGSHLVAALLERGVQVRVLDDLSGGRLENLAETRSRIEFLHDDIRDPAACRRACEGVSWVFHQAARGSVPRSMADPAATVAVNVSGTANIFTAARDEKAARVIYASSSSVYGDSPKLPKHEGEEGRPLSPYALSKVVNEQLADVFGRCYGMQFVGLRYFNVYGPRQDPEGPYAAVIPRFFKACRAGVAPVIHGDGEQSRDFTFVSDAVTANLAAAEALESACGRAYNVAGGRGTTLNDLAGLVRGVVGSGLEAEHGPARPGDIRHSIADLTLSRDVLGWTPRVDLPAGLAKTMPYYHGAIRGIARK